MYPTYRFNYPRPAYTFDLRPYYEISEGDPDEIIVNNGTITAALAPNKTHNGYLPCALRRITAPPYTLGDNIEPTLVVWGFDDDGYHMIKNTKYTMDFSLKGFKIYLDNIQFDKITNNNWAVQVEYNALPEKRVIIITYNYTNKSNKKRSLKIAGYLKNPQVTYSLEWTQYTPPTGAVNANFNPYNCYGALETTSTDNKACLIVGFNGKPDSYSVTKFDEDENWRTEGKFSGCIGVENEQAHNQYISYSFGTVAPGENVQISLVLAMGDGLENTRADYIDTISNMETRLKEAEDYWNKRWIETGFEINCPDDDINRMSELAMINGILGHDPVNKAWITSCGRAFRGVTFLWDQYYSNYGLLMSGTREMVKRVIKDTSSMDLTSNNFYGIVDKRRLGYHYSYQHYAITSLTYKYVTLFNDIEFLNEKLDNGLTVIENLSAQANYIVYGMDLDFGATWETVECVSRYIKDLPDLTANTCWMAEKIKALAMAAGRPDIARKMDPIRNKAYIKLQSLWDPNARWFKSYQGNLTYSGQVYLSILSEVLTEEQINGLMSRIDDFVGPKGVNSLASYDQEFVAENSRGDFNGAASYVGTPGEFANILNLLHDKTRLYKLIKGISTWWQWRPFQPQGINSQTGYAEGLISNEGTNNCASVYLSMVPMNFIGLTPAIGGIDVNECYPDKWSNECGNVYFNKKQYSCMVTIPYKSYKYTFYVDKPDMGDSTYSYASIYNTKGEFIKEWHGQRLPDMGTDSVIILHFSNKRPVIEELDLITKVTEASQENYVLENNCSDIYFKVNNNPGYVTHYKVKGLSGAKYTVFNNGQIVYDTVVVGKDGELEFAHTQSNDCDKIYISMVGPGKTDLALNCEIMADTSESPGFEAKNAVDGDHKTMWKSEKNELPHWIKVDLGCLRTFDRVDIHWHELKNDEYRIQVSTDGYNWYAVVYILADHISGLKTHNFEPVIARYIRVVISNRNFTSAGIYSINVY